MKTTNLLKSLLVSPSFSMLRPTLCPVEATALAKPKRGIIATSVATQFAKGSHRRGKNNV